MSYCANSKRYTGMEYRRCGLSGLKLSSVSLGLWHNFGAQDSWAVAQNLIKTAFDNGITHFDLANNYGPPPGSAEITFGKILNETFKSYRDEIVITTKAGYGMWDGPYGDWGSRKYLISSLDQSLNRMGLDYVDIFYHHRHDPETPLAETMGALDAIVRSGKALYVGLSNYSSKHLREAVAILNDLGTPCLVHQTRYSILDRAMETDLLETHQALGLGSVVFSPLEQGLLSDRYLNDIPKNSRAAREDSPFLDASSVKNKCEIVRVLHAIATEHDRNLAQLAIAWVLRQSSVTSAIIGASRPEQLLDVIGGLNARPLDENALEAIDAACAL
jgi:L-glyceraldehyde 3-phosphate reductase